MRSMAICTNESVRVSYSIYVVYYGRHSLQIDLMHNPIPWWNYVYVLESFFCPLNEMESVVITSLLYFLIL